MADSPIKTGGYKSVREGNVYRGDSNRESYDSPGHKEVAPNVYKRPVEPRDMQAPSPVIGGGKRQPDASGYRAHDGKNTRDGVLRNSGDPRASRIGKKK